MANCGDCGDAFPYIIVITVVPQSVASRLNKSMSATYADQMISSLIGALTILSTVLRLVNRFPTPISWPLRMYISFSCEWTGSPKAAYQYHQHSHHHHHHHYHHHRHLHHYHEIMSSIIIIIIIIIGSSSNSRQPFVACFHTFWLTALTNCYRMDGHNHRYSQYTGTMGFVSKI